MSFKQYVMARKRGRGPGSKVAWDFITDARMDDKLVDAKSWQELRDHLIFEGACEGAVEAGRKVWSSYRAKQRREQRRA